MNITHLRCFVAVADELHFGRAARHLDMLPAALGRALRLLEDELRTPLVLRTTRQVALTPAGLSLLHDARRLIALAEDTAARIRAIGRQHSTSLHLGAIDSAAAGLIPRVIHDFRAAFPETAVDLIEDKTTRLLPQIISGRIDLAIVRPPEAAFPAIEFLPLLHETAVVAVIASHRLAQQEVIRVEDLEDEPLILPARRSRPHSYDLTMKLFEEAGLQPHVAQQADEKQTIISLVAEGVGSAIVPRWTARMGVSGVAYRKLELGTGAAVRRLPLAAAWLKGSRDPLRDGMLNILRDGLAIYGRDA